MHLLVIFSCIKYLFVTCVRILKHVIKQNNVIIQILIQINNKLEQQDHWIKLLEEEREHDDKIDSLITQINNLKLDQNIKRTQKKQGDLIFGKV